MLQAPTLLSFFLRPKVTRTLNDNFYVEIEDIKESPGLSYIRFHDNQSGSVLLPRNLLCVNLTTSTLVPNSNDRSNKPAFLAVESSWYAFCQDQTVLAYIHATGAIYLPTEVVDCYSHSLLTFDFS